MSYNFEERLFIAGKFVDGDDNKLTVVNPATKEKIAAVHVAGAKQVDEAVAAAEKAWPSWAEGDPSVRVKALNKLADLMEENANALAVAQTSEMGKPLKISTGEVYYSARIVRYFAGLADKVHGKTSLNVPGFLGMEIRQPYGVTAGIVPWNAPIITLILKIAPALATGNAAIIKSSEKSPLSALVLAGLISKAGFPEGIVSILSGAREVGELLSSHMRIRKISFTGSTASGKAVAQAAARSNLKSVTLELGGKSPVIVFDDCDVDDAVSKIIHSFTVNSGQICFAGTRVYVQDTLFDQFAKKLVKGVQALKFGDPTEQNTNAGPQVDDLQHKRILEYLEIGKKESHVLVGGNAGDERGYYITPTIFTDVEDSSKINREEIFGPVAVLHKFTSEDEVLKRANDTEYGLASYIFTKDISRAIRFAKGLEAGQVGVNTTGMADSNLAFGGWKGSGIGRELGEHAVHAFTEVKTIFIR